MKFYKNIKYFFIRGRKINQYYRIANNLSNLKYDKMSQEKLTHYFNKCIMLLDFFNNHFCYLFNKKGNKAFGIISCVAKKIIKIKDYIFVMTHIDNAIGFIEDAVDYETKMLYYTELLLSEKFSLFGEEEKKYIDLCTNAQLVRLNNAFNKNKLNM
jgi:hypothetical protein